MDRLDSLANTLSSVTLYDIKAMYNQVRLESASSTLYSHLPAGKERRAQHQ